MKIVAFSDSHGSRDLLRDGLEQALRGSGVDVCVHCGDGACDLEVLAPLVLEANPHARIYAVRGNCDICANDLPLLELFDAQGVRMLATHGHLYDVKSGFSTLQSMAMARGAKVAFFGHTHKPFLEMVQGVMLVNPGAICSHMPGNVAYAQLIVDEQGKLRADLIKWRL